MCPFKLPTPTPRKVKSLQDLLFVILCHFLLRFNSYTIKLFFSLVTFSVFTRLHLSSLSNSRTISPLKGTLYSLSVTPPILPSLQPLAITNLHSVSVDLHILDTECKWNPVRGTLCMASYIYHNVFKVQPCHSTNQYFIPFLPEWYSIVWIQQAGELSISWWKFGLFLHFAIINSAAMNQFFVYIFSSLGYVSGFTGSHGNCFTFWGTATVSKVAALFYIPTSNVREF